MSDCATEDANSVQAIETNDLDQEIAAKKAELAEHERLAQSANLRFRTYSDASLFAFEERQRRQELWAKIVEQPHHKYFDSGELPDGSIVDLVLDAGSPASAGVAVAGAVKFICFRPPENEGLENEGEENKGEAAQIAYSEILADNHHAYLPQQVDVKMLKSIRMPREAEPYESLAQLLSDISQLILRCVAINDTDARLLAHFVLSTWLIDRLPVAPYLALVGPPQSGKTTLLRILHLLCRRSLFASDATSLSLLHACDQLHPTLLIDETSSIDDPVALRRLLRIGNTRDALVLRHRQSWNVFGAKVICWRELPDDAALNSRCITLPMHAANDPALCLPDDPAIVSTAAALQSQLLYYRLSNYSAVAVPRLELKETLSARKRELYFALAAPCLNNEESHRFLLDYFRDQTTYGEDALSAAEYSVLFALFHMAHLPEHRGQPLTKEVAARANRHLQDEREHIQLQIRRVGAILTGFGFTKRRRTDKGWTLVLEGDDHRRVHKIGERYGIDYLRSGMAGFTACHLCPAVPPTDRPVAVGVVTG